MDPISAAASILGVAGACVSIVKTIHKLIETLKEAPDALADLLYRTKSLSIVLNLLVPYEQRLNKEEKRLYLAAFDTKRCYNTLDSLQVVIENLTPTAAGWMDGVIQKAKWAKYKGDAEKLVERLKEHKDDANLALTAITGIKVANWDTSLANSAGPLSAQNELIPEAKLASAAIWFGQTALDQNSKDFNKYYSDRWQLAHAQQNAKWDMMFQILAKAKHLYKQSWANTFRLAQQGGGVHIPSGYTLLHHAAWHGASKEVVSKLLELGAWKSVRTIRGEDITPLEMAQKYGHTHLFDILAPVIRHTIPLKVMLGLQENLHNKIWKSIDEQERGHFKLRLPDISVLTELEVPDMWFPIDPERTDRGKEEDFALWFLSFRRLMLETEMIESRKKRISQSCQVANHEIKQTFQPQP
ncbi:MAG: hypothetical protein M1812_004618 [Candelaria pacifica]|nr:MAG: hypothetical protein M1812_004618 [Candelaria pacifica]